VISHLGQNVKKMNSIDEKNNTFEGKKLGFGSNVKSSTKYDRFGEQIRYLTLPEWKRFLDSIDVYEHKLAMRVIYELGCRVGEFVRIRLGDVDFQRGRIFIPKENTKTGKRRVSYFPLGLVNELKSWLRENGRIGTRTEKVRRPEEFLFSPTNDCRHHYSENRLRQIFRNYVIKAKIDRVYGRDSNGRALHELTIHSLRHSHIIHFIHEYKLPIAMVQKQVGHASLKTTSVYLNPSEEAVSEAYQKVNRMPLRGHHNIYKG
jgi:integrase/recombinase XerC